MIWRQAKDDLDAGVTKLAPLFASQLAPLDDGGIVFDTSQGDAGGLILRLVEDGGAPIVTGVDGPAAMTTAAGRVFWITLEKELHARAIDGGPDTRIASDVESSSRLFSDGESVYYVAVVPGTLMVRRVPAAGGAPVDAPCLPDVPQAMDAKYLYASMDGTVWKIPR
jgi:hypothetical protein